MIMLSIFIDVRQAVQVNRIGMAKPAAERLWNQGNILGPSNTLEYRVNGAKNQVPIAFFCRKSRQTALPLL